MRTTDRPGTGRSRSVGQTEQGYLPDAPVSPPPHPLVIAYDATSKGQSEAFAHIGNPTISFVVANRRSSPVDHAEGTDGTMPRLLGAAAQAAGRESS
jgi:hypothetical protein